MDPRELVGVWCFQRDVRDHRSGTAYSATGAQETPRDGQTETARTEPHWRVTFEDGRDFHPWTMSAVQHRCGRDLYRGGLDIPAVGDGPTVGDESEADEAAYPGPAAALSSWEFSWRVHGPEKGYAMITWYSRERSAAVPCSRCG